MQLLIEIPRLSATKSTAISLFCSFFVAFDIPVYWPILVIYFFALFAITMRRQIRCVAFYNGNASVNQVSSRHMIKYKYIPFDFVRKSKYGDTRRM